MMKLQSKKDQNVDYTERQTCRNCGKDDQVFIVQVMYCMHRGGGEGGSEHIWEYTSDNYNHG